MPDELLRLTRQTNIEHQEQLPSRIKRVFFSPEFAKPGDTVKIIIETEQVADNKEIKVKVVAEDDPENVTLDEVTGQVSGNRCEIDYQPAEGETDEAELKPKLGISMFRQFRAKAEIEEPQISYDNSDNALGFGALGVIFDSIEERFAPRRERLRIRYRFIDPDKEIKGARLYVYASNYENKNHPEDDAVVYSALIPARERTHLKEYTIKWWGDTTAETGDLKKGDKQATYINPLYSPYTVVIKYSKDNEDPDDDSGAVANRKKAGPGGQEVEWTFKVEFHSIKMELGDYVPLYEIPVEKKERDKWIQWRLNVLGYPAGPVDGNIGPMSKRAIKNFQRANWEVPWPEDKSKPRKPLVADAVAGKKTRKVLGSDQREIRNLFSSEKDLFDSSKQVKLYTYANLYYCYETKIEDGKKEWNQNAGDEFFTTKKHDKEADNFNRPYIPIIGKVMIKRRNGKPAFVSQAVGKVRVNFKVLDPAENLDQTSADVNYIPRKFIKKAGEEEPNGGDNCAKKFSGAREKEDNKSYKTYLDIGKNLKPYESKDDSANKCVYVEADPTGLEPGTAGVFFVPSYIAGDNYQLQAELDFENHPNKDNLPSDADAVKTLSAKITNWRKLKLSAYIIMGRRNNATNLMTLIQNGLVKYDKAFIEFEPPKAVHLVSRYLTQKEFKKVVVKTMKIKKNKEKQKIRLKITSRFYKDLRPQGATESAADYKNYIRREINKYGKKIEEPLGQVIVNNVKRYVREGAVIIDHHNHEPANIKIAPNNYESYVAGTHAIGLCNGLVYLDITLTDVNSMDYAHLLSHEIGHTLLLMHWENTAAQNITDPAKYENKEYYRANKKDHDHNDMNCIMSYPIDFNQFPSPPANTHLARGGTNHHIQNKADYLKFIKIAVQNQPPHFRNHQLAANYRPDFCGKCLLKLRGWDVTKLPEKY